MTAMLQINRPTLAFSHDIFMTGIAFMMAMYLRVGDWSFWLFNGDLMLIGVVLLMIIGALCYRFFGLYRGIWRYASIQDMLQLAKAVTCVTLAFVLAMFFINRLDPIPRSVPPILWLVLMGLLAGPRFLYRLFRDTRKTLAISAQDTTRVPVLMFGTGVGAELFIRSIAADRHVGYRVVGLLDDRRRQVGRAIHGIQVLGGIDDLEEVVSSLKMRGIFPQRLIITHSSAEIGGADIRRLFDRAGKLGLTLGRLPSLTEFKEAVNEGKIELRPIAVQDLLGRPQAALNRSAIHTLIAERNILVSGAGGTIGGELSRQIAALEPTRLVLLENGEYNLYAIDMELSEVCPDIPRERVLCDVRDRTHLMRVFERYRPDLVFHAAALKHVPLVEENLIQGVLTNAIGTRNVADACRAVGTIAMVLISTDKAIRPSSAMGASKRFAESYIQALDVRALSDGGETTRFMTVRFGNVLGSSGSVVPLFQRQLRRGGPITVTHPEMRRYFMTVTEAVQLVLQASAYGVANRLERGRIFVLDMGEPVRIVDLARQMIRLAGLRPDIDIRIEFTGMRPGEKLFEEILSDDEALSRTEADGVLIAAPRVIEYEFMNRAAEDLETAARAHDEERVANILHDIVPGFRSENTGSAAIHTE
ncbi:O-antigen biosynthesis protein WbqV [Azospirillaceae bacterium]